MPVSLSKQKPANSILENPAIFNRTQRVISMCREGTGPSKNLAFLAQDPGQMILQSTPEISLLQMSRWRRPEPGLRPEPTFREPIPLRLRD